MAPAAAACPSLHELEGLCEYCGERCDSTQDELNAINCTFEGCPSPEIYHQSCIEAYLKSIRLDKQRKTGFQCPRGCGKGSKWDKPCPGRVTKSHPIHARNDSSKKRRKAKMPEPAAQPVPMATSKKQAGLSKSKSANADKEMSPDAEDSKAGTTPAKAQVLNRASTFPSNHRSSDSNCSRAQSYAVASVAETQKTQFSASYMDKNSESGSAETSDSEESIASVPSSSARSKDFKEALSGSKSIPAPPIVNAWASGRPRNGDLITAQGPKEQISAVPVEIRSSSKEADTRSPTSSAAVQQPQFSQSVLAELASLEAEELELEERRKRARSKNEKKHVQRAASRLREKREALLATASSEPLHQPQEEKDNVRASPEVKVATNTDGNDASGDGHVSITIWSQKCLAAVRHRKEMLIAKQLETLGFAPWQSLMSVRTNGLNLHKCLDWLLRNVSTIHVNMPCGPGQEMDIGSELRQMEMLKSRGFTQDQIESSVINKAGDIDAVVHFMNAVVKSQDVYKFTAPPLHKFTPAAQIPILASPSAKSGVSYVGSGGSSWDGNQLSGSSISALQQSHLKMDFQSPDHFAGGDCVRDVSMYNALVGVRQDGYTPPNGMAPGSTFSRHTVLREAFRSNTFAGHALAKEVLGSAESYSHPLSSTDIYSRLSSPNLQFSNGRPSTESRIGGPLVNNPGLSRAVLGSEFYENLAEHPEPTANLSHPSSYYSESEPTVSTVTSVTAAVLNDRIDPQSVDRLTGSMGSSNSSAMNTSHLTQIWGNPALETGSNSFYSSDIVPKITASSAALSQAFSIGASTMSNSSSFGSDRRNGFTASSWSNISALTESLRNPGVAMCYPSASLQGFTASKVDPFAESESWASSKPHVQNGWKQQPQGAYREHRHPKNPVNGSNGFNAGFSLMGSRWDQPQRLQTTGSSGNARTSWLQPQGSQQGDELEQESLMKELLEVLKV